MGKDEVKTLDPLAVLIDGDNAQPMVITNLLHEVASLGEVVVKRIYGDFSNQKNSAWRKVIHNLAIRPIHQYSFTKGKNATDISLIIDAMDLLYSGHIKGFCLVTSDSDFTGLATRLRESGMKVYGFGEEKTPVSFRRACNKFILTEYLREKVSEADSDSDQETESEETKEPPPPEGALRMDLPPPVVKMPLQLFQMAAEKTAREDGWASLAQFGGYINQIQPDFDSRKYGYKKLSDLVKAEKSIFKMEYRKAGGGAQIYIQLLVNGQAR
ncbi:MAG: NYN domain-containing protein [Deltaproteobacteria bacterium]|jgi:uncharacterized LabA/DUF88 family protein|nr:NYN domain-containing protein [Deltaproteobacteria bacterium]